MLVDFSQFQKLLGSLFSNFTPFLSILVDSSQFWVNLIQFCSFWADFWSFFIGLSIFADFSWFWLILIDFLSVLVNIYQFLVYLCDIWWRYCITIPVFSVDFGQVFTDLSSIFCIYLSIVNISPFWLVSSNLRPFWLILCCVSSSSAEFWAKL